MLSAAAESLLAFARNPKAEIVTREIRSVRCPRGRAQVLESRFPASAAMYSFRSGGWTFRIDARHPAIRLIIVMAPFPDIATHVFDPKRTRAQREAPYGRTFRKTVVDLAVAPRKHGVSVGEIPKIAAAIVITPRVLSAILATRCVLPFRFGG